MKKLVCLLFLLGFLPYSGLAKNTGPTNDLFIRAIFKKPVLLNDDSIEFQLGVGRGLQLRDKQAFDFVIPATFANRIPDYAYIQHRKEYVYFNPDENGIDPNNPWLQFFFHDRSTNSWKLWSDQFGSKKRSAVRPDEKPKKNTLFNFPEFVGNFSPDRVRIVNSIDGCPDLAVASIHKLGVVYLNKSPEIPSSSPFAIKDYKIVNNLAIKYILGSSIGLELRQNQSFEFLIPKQFQDRPIFHVILKHRKDPSFAIDPSNPDAIDPNAAYILCEARDRKTGFWHKWSDRSSLAKFSEVRTPENPEDETLHNCLRAFGNIYPDRFKLSNVGIGDANKCIANIHEIEIVFAPKISGNEKIEKIFTPETSFSQANDGRPVPLLGGGPRLGGKFPGALILGKKHRERALKIQNLAENYRFETGSAQGDGYLIQENGELLLELPANKVLESVELAIGDLDNTSLETNKDGYFGRSGMAEVSIFLDRQNKKSIPLLQGNNIGMAGMVVAGGPWQNVILRSGDMIRVRVDNDEAFLMGYRIILKEK